MDGLRVYLTVLLGVFCSPGHISASISEVTVRPGDNITVYCDCKVSTGVYIVWYRNCFHETQPPLILKVDYAFFHDRKRLYSKFHLLRNFSSDSYDLLIKNVTDSDEGLYYCGTETMKVEGSDTIKQILINSYGNITTRITCETSPHPECSPERGVAWIMMAVTPALTILSSSLIFIWVYHICQKTDEQCQDLHKRRDTKGPRRRYQDEDVCLTEVVFWLQDGRTYQ